jgi:membrane associated rhomboid family serine protease
MTTSLRRNLSALAFAVFWTVFMVWWSGDYGITNIVILAVCGLIVGAVWAWAMGRVQRRRDARAK